MELPVANYIPQLQLPDIVGGYQQANANRLAQLSAQQGIDRQNRLIQLKDEDRQTAQTVRLLSGVTDQASYDKVLSMFEQTGDDHDKQIVSRLKQIPYSPELVTALKSRLGSTGASKPIGVPQKIITDVGGKQVPGLVQPVWDPVMGAAGVQNIDLGGARPAFDTLAEKLAYEAKKKAMEVGATEATENVKIGADIKKVILQDGQAADIILPKLARLRQALSLIGSGKTAQAKAIFGQYLPGVDPSDEQALNAAMSDFIMSQLKSFKGATSDRELAFAERTTVSLGKSKKANLLILDRLEKEFGDVLERRRQFKAFKGRPEDFEFKPVKQAPATKIKERKRARNPQTGEEIEWDGTQWIKVK